MRSRIPAILVSIMAFCTITLFGVANGVGEITQTDGDFAELNTSAPQITFADFSTEVADIIITEIDSSEFPLMKIHVDVIDSFGVLLCGLTEEEFCVFQDGDPVDFQLASLDSLPCPVSVCLVMDVSGSMEGKPLQHAKDAAISFVRNMGPSARTAIVAYASCVELVQGFTSDTTLLIDAINSMSAGGRTAMFDGFWLGVDVTCPEPDIKAVIGFTDGRENNSQACWPPPDGVLIDTIWSDDCDTVASYALDCRFPIYTIGLSPDAWPELLICLAENTGGQYHYAPSAEQLDSIYQKIQSRLCCRYMITYTSPDTVKDCDVHQVVVCEGGGLCTPCDTAYFQEPCPPSLRRTPPTIALSEVCQPPTQNLVIEAWATDSVPPFVQEVDLFWRVSGTGPSYAKIVMSQVSDSLYRGIIPGALLPVGTAGAEYYLTATDGELTVSDPPVNPAASPYLIEICPNAPPELTCPEDDSINAGDLFVSTDYSVTDPDNPSGVVVTLHSISPSPTHAPTLVGKHVEWHTACADLDIGPFFTITLVATDPWGAKDTCDFTVKVYNRPPEIICPEGGSVHAGELVVTGDFSATDPKKSVLTVNLCGITPDPVHPPTIVESHLEWQTDCADAGKLFIICLEVVDDCGRKDSCYFQVEVYNHPPELVCPEDDSVHADELFISGKFEVSDPDDDPLNVSLCGITPAPVNPPALVGDHLEWQTDCDDAGKTFTICLKAEDDCGVADTCYFDVTVYNRVPELTCPDDGVAHAGQTFVSLDFSVTDPDGDPTPVGILDINPSAINDPTIVESHVEWVTTIDDDYIQDYVIRLVVVDPCGLADTCRFTVTLDEPTGEFECPQDDSVHAGELFVSGDFILTYPECDPSSVEILDITPPVTHAPTMVDYHVEWLTTCAEEGDYVIRLMTGEECSIPDTCEFTVTVYNRPPELTCPDYGWVQLLHLFVSTDFFTSDPDGDEASVSLLGIDPPAEHDPVIVENHVEWQTECVEGDYIITLIAVDPCGLADTCEFMVTVSADPAPDFYIWVYPVDQHVAAGQEAGYLVELNSMYGFHKPCSLRVSGLPAPPNNGVFDQVVLTPTNTTNLTVYTTLATPVGSYTLTISGKEIGGPVQHSVQVGLEVGEPSDAGEDTDNPNVPASFSLFQNQPNPFNPQTQISYYLPADCQAQLTIYNVLGRTVRTLFDGYQSAGMHTVTWNGRDDDGAQLGSGIYFYRLKTEDFDQTKKMVLMK